MQRGVPSWAVVALAASIIAVAVWLALRGGEPLPLPERTGVAAVRSPRREAAEPGGEAAASGPRRTPAARLPAPDAEALGAEGSAELEEEGFGSWEEVDLEAVRAAMPDNLYWKLSAPTQDPRLIEERAAERARWNVEYGKILSGTASEEEIRAYFDHRARLSGDYVEFVTHVLDHYEETLPERDVGLLKLARRLHQARLEEIPRKVEEALERKREQDAAREAWRRDQALFDEGQDRTE
jgi:hypothetical protein